MGRYNNYFINLLKAAIAKYFAVIFNLLRGRPLLSLFPDQRQIRNILNTITKHQIRDIQDQCIQTVPRYTFRFWRLLSGFPQTYF
jgi:hypothetical protein